MTGQSIEEIPIRLIDDPTTELRMGYDPVALHALAQSIATQGLLQPIGVVAVDGSDRFRRVWGGRRLEAHRLIGRLTIRAIIILPGAPELDAAVIENLDRADLSAIEEAQAIKAALDAGYSVAQLTARWHRSEQWVTARLELLGFPPDLQEKVHRRELRLSVAAHLARVDNDSYRLYLTESAITGGATAIVVRGWVAEYEAQRPRIIHNQAAIEDLKAQPRNFTVLMDCDGCGEPTDLKTLRSYRICPRCNAALLATAGRAKE